LDHYATFGHDLGLGRAVSDGGVEVYLTARLEQLP